jgi:alpha-N-arabinofuranosidase
MYKVHHDATMLPLELNTPLYSNRGRSMDAISASASRDKDGKIHVSLVNLDPNNSIEVNCDLKGLDSKAKFVSANIVTADKIDSHNTFDNPNIVELKEFKDASLKNQKLQVKMPAKSVVTVEIL